MKIELNYTGREEAARLAARGARIFWIIDTYMENAGNPTPTTGALFTSREEAGATLRGSKRTTATADATLRTATASRSAPMFTATNSTRI